MHQVTLIRNRVLSSIKSLKIWISCLPQTEHEALKRLEGADGNRTAARIADFILQELGHQPPEVDASGHSPTIKAARSAMGTRRV